MKTYNVTYNTNGDSSILFSSDDSEKADWLAENHPETLTVNTPDKQAERNRIGLLIRRERERQGLSLRDLAARCGIAHSHILRIENGRYSVTLDILSKVAAALGKKVTLE